MQINRWTAWIDLWL